MKIRNKNKPFALTHQSPAVLAVTALIAITLIFTGCKQPEKPKTPEPPAPTPKHTVTFNVAGEGGTLKATVDGSEISPGNNVEQGKSVTFTAEPNAGWQVAGWTGVTATPPNSKTVTLSNVTGAANVTVKFKFADKTYTVDGISFTMRIIDAVTNGSVGHDDYDKNKPHTVSLNAYRIGETEVTQELWQKVMDNNPSYFSATPESSEKQEKRPVEKVNWYHAIAFCNKLSKKCNLESCYTVTVSGTPVDFDTLIFDDIPISDNDDWNKAVCNWTKNGFRLPMEAEWEWAAMGGTDNKWAGTNNESELKNYAWYDVNSGFKTHQTAKSLANGYRLYDMSGNVAEWCWNRYKDETPEDGQDPIGPDSGKDRVIRGGGCINNAKDAGRAHRLKFEPDKPSQFIGMRLACRP